MDIMGRSRQFEPETCRRLLDQALEKYGNRATAEDLFQAIARTGHWTDDTIWQTIMESIVNIPVLFYKYPIVPIEQRFLFQREDGYFERYDPKWHGRYDHGHRL